MGLAGVALWSCVAGAVPLVPCTLETVGAGRTSARCGEVIVDGGVKIGFAVLEATGDPKKPDPVVILPGGPGQAATELGALLDVGLGEIRRDRDIVLFDPRGTGRSGRLSCPDPRDLPTRLRATDTDEEKLLRGCAATLPIDPRSITTPQIAADLDAVRAALGVETWNLLGISYGTRLGLVYDRAFPGRARSLVLDSVVPFSMIVGETAAADATAALQALDARCRATPGCAPPSGRSLMDIVHSMRRTLNAVPRDVTLPHPSRAAPVTLRLDGDTASSVVQQLLYAEEGAAILPPMLRSADAGDLAPLAAQLFFAERTGDTLSRPMQLSVLCAEDAPFFSASAVGDDAAADQAPFADPRRELTRACALWPHATVPRTFHDDAPASQTPALLLSGTADPITPPAHALSAIRTLPRARHLVGTGLGHNVIFRGCLREVVRDFLDAGTSDGLDVGCAAQLGPFPVFVDGLGPAP